jgi:hypothetical protein
MKKVLFLVFIVIVPLCIPAKDLLYFKNGIKQPAKIIEVFHSLIHNIQEVSEKIHFVSDATDGSIVVMKNPVLEIPLSEYDVHVLPVSSKLLSSF